MKLDLSTHSALFARLGVPREGGKALGLTPIETPGSAAGHPARRLTPRGVWPRLRLRRTALRQSAGVAKRKRETREKRCVGDQESGAREWKTTEDGELCLRAV